MLVLKAFTTTMWLSQCEFFAIELANAESSS